MKQVTVAYFFEIILYSIIKKKKPISITVFHK